MVSQTSMQQINEKEMWTTKPLADAKCIAYVSISIDRLNLRAKNYAKQEKVIFSTDGYDKTEMPGQIEIDPYVALLARICTYSMAGAETGGQEAFLS